MGSTQTEYYLQVVSLDNNFVVERAVAIILIVDDMMKEWKEFYDVDKDGLLASKLGEKNKARYREGII